MNKKYETAKLEADNADLEVINAIKNGVGFRMEAGAGSGKTYSLIKTIEWIEDNKVEDYKHNKQNVICITYTNAAVDVISTRIKNNSSIIPSTIHSFAWNSIKQFQSFLIYKVQNDQNFFSNEGDFLKIKQVSYTLGNRYRENGIQYLSHEDVLMLFCELLDNVKFRRVFSSKYPLILIDEYQDSYKPIIDRFIKYFISENIKPQFGFFGDSWQTIYQSNHACGLIESKNIRVINKVSNFRSSPKIVELLNYLRTDLQQISAIDDFEGEIYVITCKDFLGKRRLDRNFKNDLPVEELRMRLEKLEEKVKKNIDNNESLKILMISHKVLANQQGYEKLLEIINNSLRDKEDPFLLFFMNTVEPIYQALETNNMQLLFDTLKIRRYPINKKNEKEKWKEFYNDLKEARKKNAINVLNAIKKSKLFSIPTNLESYMNMYSTAPETIYSSSTIKKFLDLEYQQFISSIEFLKPDSVFSTEHGVKGEEYDNVIFAITKGWNQYQFDIYAPMIHDNNPPDKLQASFERNRNLFYVCCSRAKKRLYFFITFPIDNKFESFLKRISGGNYYSYDEFMKNV